MYSFTEIMIVISGFLEILNPTASSLSSRTFISIILQELWNCMLFKGGDYFALYES